MAEEGGSNRSNDSHSRNNPFSFKTFVKSKQETNSPKTKKKQDKLDSKASALNQRKRDNLKDEAPFPEINKQGKINFHLRLNLGNSFETFPSLTLRCNISKY